MARAAAGLPAGIRLSDHISLGVIARTFPLDEVRQVLVETDRVSARLRDLPAHVMVYYAIALALYMGSGTREVLRCLLEGLRWPWGAEAVKVAGKSGISQARARLGEVPAYGTPRQPCAGLIRLAILRRLVARVLPGQAYMRGHHSGQKRKFDASTDLRIVCHRCGFWVGLVCRRSAATGSSRF